MTAKDVSFVVCFRRSPRLCSSIRLPSVRCRRGLPSTSVPFKTDTVTVVVFHWRGERERSLQDDDAHGRPRPVEPDESDEEGTRPAEDKEGTCQGDEGEEAAFLDGMRWAFRTWTWRGRAGPRTRHSSATDALFSPLYPGFAPSFRLPFDHATQNVDPSPSTGPSVSFSSFQTIPFEPESIRFCSRFNVPFQVAKIDVRTAKHVKRLFLRRLRSKARSKEAEKGRRNRRTKEPAASTHARGREKKVAKTRQNTSKQVD